MRDGFISVAALTPKVKVADPKYNRDRICELIDSAAKTGAQVMVFPELCITGYTCNDLFYQELLLKRAREELLDIAAYSEKTDAIIFVGLPLEYNSKLYNVAAAICGGSILGLVPKTHIPNYNEFYEWRHFAKGMESPVPVRLDDDHVVPMGTRLLFSCRQMPGLKIGAEICEDLWAPNPPSIGLAMAGATLIVNLSASDETTGKDVYRRNLVSGQSARLICGYVYASAGDGESTQDVVYSGHNLIAENGVVLAESRRFINEGIYSEIDMQRLNEERRRMSTYGAAAKTYMTAEFHLKEKRTVLTRFVDPAPFVPGKRADREKRCEEILMIQAMGLKKRLEHTNCQAAVVGISGGLDSTLALLVTVKAFDLLGKDHKGIIAVTMPGFGTTDRTYENAVSLIRSLGATLKEVPISEAVRIHFRDIEQDEQVHDVTYENGQARERTQILMDIANKLGGMVIGTGDMSELALGWATYNGDHMSMYGVNASVPKTLVRHLVRYYADTCGDPALNQVLLDVLDTPVSPELLPPEDGKISQKTEDIVGPYELHDFFLYYVLRFGCPPKKIYRLARYAFAGTYSEDTIEKWLKTFYRRFFSQQFKRSCLPDGPKVGTVAVSPRGDLRMPSDACARIWMDELEHLREEEEIGCPEGSGNGSRPLDAFSGGNDGESPDASDNSVNEKSTIMEEFDKDFDAFFKGFM
ncbi:MAG: NAD(+) synthase [Clostridiales bacterium]|nr:NAD(+) synthase [Clostridiales bacterium]